MSPILTAAWNYPTRILHGPGRIQELAETGATLGIKRPLFVTDAGLVSAAITADARGVLTKAKLAHAIFSDIKPNPVGANIEAGVMAFRQGDHDGVIAFGGGSGLDLGKLVAFMAGQTRPV